MKKFRKFVCGLIIAVILFTGIGVGNVEAASSATVDLGGGYSVRIDRPHDTKTGKWHGHVYKGQKQIGAENVDGTKHDGKDFSKVPKKTLDKLKSNKKWKDAKSKNDKLVKERSNLTWKNFLTWLAKNTFILNI